MSRPPWTYIARVALPVGAAALLLASLTWPLLLTSSGFSGDWERHLWLVWHQGRSIDAGLAPSFFLNSSNAVFDPLYAFYGGTLYALAGALSLLLGEAPVQAYVLVYLLDFLAAFGGLCWLSRMAGLGRWQAMVPGLVLVTSSYYVMLVYVRGDWPEFTGVSMIPLMLAAALSVLRAERLRWGPACALAASCVVFFGAHNITILYGLTTIALAAAAAVACVPEARTLLTWAGVGRVARIAVPAALVSAWYLVPAFVFASRTRLGGDLKGKQEVLHNTHGLVAMRHLLTLSRASAETSRSAYPFALSLPVVAIAWVLAGLLVLVPGARRSSWVRMLLICSGIALLAALLMTHVGLLLALPSLYWMVQFSYRLESYVLLALSGAILVGLALARRGSRPARYWTLLAVPVCAVSLAGAVEQILAYPYPGGDRYAALASFKTAPTGEDDDYQDVSGAPIGEEGLQSLQIPVSAIRHDRVSFGVRAPRGTLVATNVAAGPYLVEVSGAQVAGVDTSTQRMVLRLGGGESSTVSIRPASGLPIVLGRALSLCGVALLVLQLLLPPAWRLAAVLSGRPPGWKRRGLTA